MNALAWHVFEAAVERRGAPPICRRERNLIGESPKEDRMIDISHILVLSQPQMLHRQVQSVFDEAEAVSGPASWRVWRRLRARA